MSFNTAAAAMFSVVVAVSGAAQAKEPVARVGNGYVVSYADLDLSTIDGREVFADRLESAVSRHCRRQPHRALHQITRCERDMIEQIIEDATQPVRTALEAQRNHRG